MTSSDSPAEGVSTAADSNEAPFDDVITLSTSSDGDGIDSRWSALQGLNP